MKDFGRYAIIASVVMFTLALASLVAPVSAVNPTIEEETYVQQLLPDTNNHTYVYYDGEHVRSDSRSFLDLEDGANLWRTRYYSGTWVGSGTFYWGPAQRHIAWQRGSTISQGQLGRSFYLPAFYDFD
ncbi:MAG: hypothetical protein ACFFD9_06910, partial [Candidatus Thorarchaeota archaeon]